MDVPDRPLSFVPVKAGEVLTLGLTKLRILEDGSNTGELLDDHDILDPGKN